MADILDFVGLQNDVAAVLMNRDELQNVNVVQYRQYVIQKEVDLRTMLDAPRNGRYGTAVVVEMPRRSVRHPNLPGPEFYLSVPVVSLSIPEMALKPVTGSGLDAEACDQLVGDTLHGFRPRATLGFQFGAEERYSAPAKDVGDGAFEVPRGVLAYRSTHSVRVTRTQTPRCPVPAGTYSATTGLFTLTNGALTPTADIWYTTDGNYPGQFPTLGVVSTKYTESFPVASGDVVRWAAYWPAGGYQASFGGWASIP